MGKASGAEFVFVVIKNLIGKGGKPVKLKIPADIPDEDVRRIVDQGLRSGQIESVAELPMDAVSKAQRREAMGMPSTWWHGTRADVDEFYSEPWPHAGSRTQAEERLKMTREDVGGSRFTPTPDEKVRELAVREGKQLRMKDVGSWDNASTVAHGLLSTPIGRKHANQIHDIIDEIDQVHEQFAYADNPRDFIESSENMDALEEMRGWIQDEGYDSIVYANEVENLYGKMADLTPKAKAERAAVQKEIQSLDNAISARRPGLKDNATAEDVQAWLDLPDAEPTPIEASRREALKARSMALSEQVESPDSIIMLDGSQARDTKAKFDPFSADSPNLLASSLPVAATGLIGLGALTGSEQAEAGPVSRGGRKFIEAWHGSPHDFDEFKMSQIGTGEGAQAYGHGLYAADARETAEAYREALTDNRRQGMPPTTVTTYKSGGVDIPQSSHDWQAADVANMMQEFDIDPNTIDGKEWFESEIGARGFYIEQADKSLKMFADGVEKNTGRGRLYNLEIDATPDELLDWDKPLSVQPEMMATLEDVLSKWVTPNGRTALENITTTASGGLGSLTGSRLMDVLAKGGDARRLSTGKNVGQDRVSQVLNSGGIKGIQYNDAMSRGAEGGTKNYVVFDDRLITIAKKYGISLPLASAVVAGTMTPEQAQAGVGSTAADVVKKIQADFPDVKIDFHSRDNSDTATLSRVVVPEDQRSSGVGTEIMGRLNQWADANGKTIALTPSGDFGGSVSRLKKFYKEQGFVENKGRNKDYEISESMLRVPKIAAGASALGGTGAASAMPTPIQREEITSLNQMPSVAGPSQGYLAGLGVPDAQREHDLLMGGVEQTMQAPTNPRLSAFSDAMSYADDPIAGNPFESTQNYTRALGLGQKSTKTDKFFMALEMIDLTNILQGLGQMTAGRYQKYMRDKYDQRREDAPVDERYWREGADTRDVFGF